MNMNCYIRLKINSTRNVLKIGYVGKNKDFENLTFLSQK